VTAASEHGEAEDLHGARDAVLLVARVDESLQVRLERSAETVVVRDRDEVQPATGRRIRGHKHRARHLRPRKAVACAVAMPRVHVEVAPVPRRTIAQRASQRRGLVRHQPRSGEEDLGRVARDLRAPEVRPPEQQLGGPVLAGAGLLRLRRLATGK